MSFSTSTSAVEGDEPIKVLVTGFGPFDGIPSNPTGDIIESDQLPDELCGVEGCEITFEVLPVNHPIGPTIQPHIDKDYDLIINLGVSGALPHDDIRVESGATNCFRDPATGQTTCIDPNKPADDFSESDIPDDLPDEVGNNDEFDVIGGTQGQCGTFVCNETLREELDDGQDAIFIHVPNLPSDKHDDLAAALGELIEAIIEDRKCQHPESGDPESGDDDNPSPPSPPSGDGNGSGDGSGAGSGL